MPFVLIWDGAGGCRSPVKVWEREERFSLLLDRSPGPRGGGRMETRESRTINQPLKGSVDVPEVRGTC